MLFGIKKEVFSKWSGDFMLDFFFLLIALHHQRTLLKLEPHQLHPRAVAAVCASSRQVDKTWHLQHAWILIKVLFSLF